MPCCHAECPNKVKASGGEEICCEKDTCLVDVPSKWGPGVLFTAYYPTTPYDGKAKVPTGTANKLTLATGTCAYTSNDYWLCATVRLRTI